MRVFYILIVAVFFASHSVKASEEGEILHKTVHHYNAGTAVRMTEETYPFTYQVINSPEKIKEHKAKMEEDEKSFVDFPNITDVKNALTFGMGEYKFREDGSFLHTRGLRDCIALAAFDKNTKKSVLYHVSKMELHPNEFGDLLFQKYFIPEFLNFFGLNTPKITLIGSTYSKDLDKLLELLETNNLKVTDYNFPDVVMEKTQTIDPVSKFILEGSMTIFFDENSVQLKNWSLPDTQVLLNTQDGSITISRD